MLTAVVHPASVQDGAVLVLDARTRRRFPLLRTIFADSAYGGPKRAKALAGAAWKIEVVKRPKDQKGFEVLPRRWVVERTIAWINRSDVWPRISKISTVPHSPSSASPPSGLCYED